MCAGKGAMEIVGLLGCAIWLKHQEFWLWSGAFLCPVVWTGCSTPWTMNQRVSVDNLSKYRHDI